MLGDPRDLAAAQGENEGVGGRKHLAIGQCAARCDLSRRPVTFHDYRGDRVVQPVGKQRLEEAYASQILRSWRWLGRCRRGDRKVIGKHGIVQRAFWHRGEKPAYQIMSGCHFELIVAIGARTCPS